MVREAFSRAAAKPEGISGIDFLEAILRERPDLRELVERDEREGGLRPEFRDEGWCSHVIIIGNEVFKAPKNADFIRDFDKEPALLQEMKGKGLPVPEVTYIGKESVFFSMTKMPGDSLDTLIRKMSMHEMQRLAEDVVDFMIDMAKALKRPPGLFALQGDLKESNIFVDPVTKRLTGIIDFGMATDVPKNYFGPRNTEDGEFRYMINEILLKRRTELPSAPVHSRKRMARAAC